MTMGSEEDVLSTIRYEHEGHIATVTIDRPERRNALNSEVLTDLQNALEYERMTAHSTATSLGRSQTTEK